jgi:hypothetical protein
MTKTKRKSRDDLEGIGKFDPYIERNKWDHDIIDGALKPYDKLVTDLETRWGYDRLPQLVSPETAAKFQTAKAKMDAAIAYAKNPQEAVNKIGVMMRGWQALEKEAMQNHKPFPPDVWIACVDEEHGKPALEIAIVKTSADASLTRNNITTYSLVEIARIVRLFEGKKRELPQIKELFPDSEIKRANWEDDDIPF